MQKDEKCLDSDSLIRSKAAMYTILETITAAVNIALKEIDKIRDTITYLEW